MANKTMIHICDKDSKFDELLKLTYSQEEKLNSLIRALKGNGQPGFIKESDIRLRCLEEDINQVKGALKLIKYFPHGALVTLFVSLISVGIHFIG